LTTEDNDPREDFSEPLGHGATVRGLWRAARAGRLPHALLLTGPAGIGKFRAARWFMLGLYCEHGIPAEGAAPCGECGPCKRVIAASHLDVFTVDLLQTPADERPEDLKIGRFVRRERDSDWDGPTVDEFLALRAAEGGWRVVLVREMERANVAAQNSILKMLEEPAPGVLWILECSRKNDLLPTIASRCVQVQFERLPETEVAHWLLEHGVARERAAQLARWSRGSPGEALRSLAQREWEVRGLIVEALRGGAPPLAAAAAVWELEGTFEGKTAKAIERARARTALDLAIACLRDLTLSAEGQLDDTLRHGDLAALGLDLARSPARLRATLELLLDLRRDVESNIDPPMLLDRAFLALGPTVAARAAGAR
jgi:DNA polymerase-3 subunit delta'